MTLKNNRAPLLSSTKLCASPYVNSSWSFCPETTKWVHNLCDLDLWPLTLTFCMDITSVNDNNSWKFQDDTMTETSGVYYWCVKIPQCGCIKHGLSFITLYVQKHIAALAKCYNLPLVRDKPQWVRAFVKLVYSNGQFTFWHGCIWFVSEHMSSFFVVSLHHDNTCNIH